MTQQETAERFTRPQARARGRTLAWPTAGGPRPRGQDGRLRHLGLVTAEWVAELEKCVEETGIETVHRVRTGTRRVEATLEVLLRALPAGQADESPVKAAARNWLRQLKKIRRAAGPVRDLDVHRKLVEEFAGIGKAGKKEHERMEQSEVEQRAATPERKVALEEQATRLDLWLRHAREQHAGEMVKEIQKRLPKLPALAAEFRQAWSRRRGRRDGLRGAAAGALEEFGRLSEEMPLLDAGNLHEFRKRAKRARYIAEAGGKDAHAQAVVRAIQRVQDSIGEWHDWLSLAEEARIALDGSGTELAGMLDTEVERSFQQAKQTTERMRGRLVGEWHATTGKRRPPARAAS